MPPITRNFFPRALSVPAALMVSTALGTRSTGCSLGVLLIPETFPCVQDHAVPTGIAYQRFQSGPSANPTIAASSKGMLFKSVLEKCEAHTWSEPGEVPQLPGKPVQCYSEQLMLAFISPALNQCLRTSPVHWTGMWIYLTSGRLLHS